MLSCKAKVVAILMAMALMLSVLAGCAQEELKKLQFGCALSLSGRLEEEGHLTKKGYELWKERINSQGGTPSAMIDTWSTSSTTMTKASLRKQPH